MTQFLRNYRVQVVALVLVTAFLGYLLCELHQPLPASPPSVAPISAPPASAPLAAAQAPPDSAQESSLLRTAGAPLAPTLRSLTSKPRRQPSDDERRIAAATLQKIHESLAKAELTNVKVVGEKTYTNGGKGKFLEVGPMPPELTAEAYAELGRGLHALGPDSPVAARLKYDALTDIELFTDRRKPFKLILVQDQKGDGQNIYILDLLIDDHETLMRDVTDHVQFSEGNGPGQALVRSGYFKKSDGKTTEWVTKRYAHFFPEAR